MSRRPVSADPFSGTPPDHSPKPIIFGRGKLDAAWIVARQM